jgi:hypothetical protein
MIQWLRNLFSRKPVRLAIVRRYADANGSYVGELYMDQAVRRKHDTFTGYAMIGVSLDTLPLDWVDDPATWCGFTLDTMNDFLAPMTLYTVRVGALDPQDNDNVRKMVARLPRRNMTLVIQNRFIEHVMEPKR